MNRESAVISAVKAESLEERMNLLYLREAEVPVKCPVQAEDGKLVMGEEKLYLRAPSQRQVLEASFALRKKNASDFELSQSQVELPEDLDLESATDEELDKAGAVMRLNTAIAVSNLRLCCYDFRKSDDTFLERLIEINGGVGGELAETAQRLCGTEASAAGGGFDPF